MRLFLIMLLLPFVAAADVDLVIDGKSVDNGRVEITTGGPGDTPSPEPDPTPDPTSCASNPFMPFPGTNGTKYRLEIREGSVESHCIVAPERGYGKLFFISDTHAPSGTLEVVISEAKGSFSPAGSRCRKNGGTVSFWWETSLSSQYMCSLDPGKQYWINMRYPDCGFRTCGHLMQWDNPGA